MCVKLSNSTPQITSTPDLRNENIKYFIFSSRNRTHNLPRLQSHACSLTPRLASKSTYYLINLPTQFKRRKVDKSIFRIYIHTKKNISRAKYTIQYTHTYSTAHSVVCSTWSVESSRSRRMHLTRRSNDEGYHSFV